LAFLSLPEGAKAAKPKITHILFQLGEMDIDPKISINEITDEEFYLILKGNAPTKMGAYDLAEKILQSERFKSYELIDVIPVWENGKITLMLKKNVKKENHLFYVDIIAPKRREKLTEKVEFKGTCSRNGGEVVLSGDVNLKTTCTNNEWRASYTRPKSTNLPIISVIVQQTMINRDVITDYRSFSMD
jgi:hypothetical protein